MNLCSSILIGVHASFLIDSVVKNTTERDKIHWKEQRNKSAFYVDQLID